MRSHCRLLLLLLAAFPLPLPGQSWYTVQGRHVLACSAGNSRDAREAARRADQVVAFFAETFYRKEVTFSTPLVVFAGPMPPSPLVRTPMAVYLTVDPSRAESVSQMARDLTALSLEDNYPRAQSWFDAGMVSYLGALRFAATQTELGAPPRELEETLRELARPESSAWIPFARLVRVKDPGRLGPEEQSVFAAESWALVRWIVNGNRIAQAGEFLKEVEWHKVPPEEAALETFSLGMDEWEKSVRATLADSSTSRRASSGTASLFYAERKMSPAEARVLQLAPRLFAQDTQAAAMDELLALMRQEQEDAPVHRALAWAFLNRRDLPNAMEHVRRALALNDSDPAMHYLYALLANEGDAEKMHAESAVPRLATELKDALRRNPNYAAAFELLGLAQLNDGQFRPALQNLERASALRPRDSRYSLNLARAYAAQGSPETARNLLLYLQDGADAEVAAEAGRLLREPRAPQKNTRMFGSVPLPAENAAGSSRYDNLQEAIAEDEAAETAGRAKRDDRRTEHLRGRLVRVECTEDSAVLEVSAEGKRWSFRVPERNRAVLHGVAAFDCGWHAVSVAINYKPAGERTGDLVSLEMIRGK